MPVKVADIDEVGQFVVAVPREWPGSVVYCAVVSGEKLVGSGNYSIALDQTIVVSDPSRASSFEFRVVFKGCDVERAAMLLQSPRGTSGWGEAIWKPREQVPRIELVAHPDKIAGPVAVMVGELSPDNTIQYFERLEFASLAQCMDAGAKTIDIQCAAASVSVPAFEGEPVLQVKFWSAYGTPRSGAWIAVADAVAKVRCGHEMSMRAMGVTSSDRQVLGTIMSEGASHRVVWLTSIEPQLEQRILIQDQSGAAVAGLHALLDSETEVSGGQVVKGLHRLHARSDQEGWITAKGLCRGVYRLSIEPHVLGEFQRQDFRIEVPGPASVCTVTDSQVVRLALAMPLVPVNVSAMRAWVREGTSTQWTDATDPRWQFSLSGVIGRLASGPHDFAVSLPPFVGATNCILNGSRDVVEIVVPMVQETTVSGTVRDASGKPAAGCLVTSLKCAVPSGPDWSMSRSGVDGRFQVVLVPGHDCLITAWDRAGRTPVASCVASSEVALTLPADW